MVLPINPRELRSSMSRHTVSALENPFRVRILFSLLWKTVDHRIRSQSTCALLGDASKPEVGNGKTLFPSVLSSRSFHKSQLASARRKACERENSLNLCENTIGKFGWLFTRKSFESIIKIKGNARERFSLMRKTFFFIEFSLAARQPDTIAEMYTP